MPAFAGIFLSKLLDMRDFNFSSNRWLFSLRAAAVHLVASAIVISVLAWIVFSTWFVQPWREVSGGMGILLLVLCVDVVCGPILTLIVFDPRKNRKELLLDLVSILVLQLSALGYGVHTLSQTHPLAIVFEVDRFRAVGYADLDESEADRWPEWVSPWTLSGPRVLAARRAHNSEEKFASIDASIQGIEPGQRPSWWQNYQSHVSEVLAQSRSVVDLRARLPDQSQILQESLKKSVENALDSETKNPEELRWLPLVSRRSTDWVVIIDPVTARIRGYSHVNGFDN